MLCQYLTTNVTFVPFLSPLPLDAVKVDQRQKRNLDPKLCEDHAAHCPLTIVTFTEPACRAGYGRGPEYTIDGLTG